MEASTATPEAPAEPVASHDGEAEATRSTEELFQWSGYVHVGRGAEDCEHGIDGECTDPQHFHAWVCLPNTYQFRDIDGKARAAKARKARALRDPETDSYAVLEEELEDVRVNRFDELIEGVARKRAEKYLSDIIEGLSDDERFEHRAQDAEEFRRQSALPEDERDEEEYERLQRDMLDYADAVKEGVDKQIATEKAALEAMDPKDVLDIERRSRIEDVSQEMYYHIYYKWAAYIGARVPTTSGFSSRRKFEKPEDLHAAPPEVVAALREKINTLEMRTVVRGEAAGN